MAKAYFEFVDGLGGNPRGEDLVQAFERVMVSFEAADTVFDSEARFHGLIHGAKAGEWRQIAVRRVCVHGNNIDVKPCSGKSGLEIGAVAFML